MSLENCTCVYHVYTHYIHWLWENTYVCFLYHYRTTSLFFLFLARWNLFCQGRSSYFTNRFTVLTSASSQNTWVRSHLIVCHDGKLKWMFRRVVYAKTGTNCSGITADRRQNRICSDNDVDGLFSPSNCPHHHFPSQPHLRGYAALSKHFQWRQGPAHITAGRATAQAWSKSRRPHDSGHWLIPSEWGPRTCTRVGNRSAFSGPRPYGRSTREAARDGPGRASRVRANCPPVIGWILCERNFWRAHPPAKDDVGTTPPIKFVQVGAVVQRLGHRITCIPINDCF